MLVYILLFAGVLIIAALNKLPEKYSKALGIALAIGLVVGLLYSSME